MLEYLTKEGIEHQQTTRYTPEQNGVAERMNRTLGESTRAMLHTAKLPYKLWPEAWETARYLYSKSPIKALALHAVPEAKFKRFDKDKKPSVAHLRIFGCAAFTHVPKQLRSKLEPRSQKLIFVAYSSKSKPYTLWNPETDEITISRDVILDESNLGTDKRHQEDNEPLIVAEANQEYELERIVSERTDNGQREVLVKWKGYPDSYNTWEPYENLKDTIAMEQWESSQSYLVCDTSGTRDPLLTDDPKTRGHALIREDAGKWKEAMDEEFKSLVDNGTWEIVPRPQSRPTIESKWVFKTKRDTNGFIIRYKARLVAKGFTQIQGLDFEETFSPTVSHTAIRTIFAIAAMKGLEIHQMDVKAAYLNGEIDKELFLEQPEGYETPECPRNKYVCKLNKALYGLKQAGRLWNITLHRYLISQSYHQISSEPCVYVQQVKGNFTIIAVYVDDLAIASNDTKALREAKEMLKERFMMTDLGTSQHILGLRVQRKENNIFIDQAHYVERILEKFRMLDCHPVATPMDTSLKLTPLADGDKTINNAIYRSAVGSLMYAAVATRPDIAAAVGIVARYVEKPGNAHWAAVKRIMRYLKGTMSYGLAFRHQNNDDARLIAYCDADWAGDISDRKSTSGYVMKLCGAVISWKAVRQECVALSTVEAEYIAAATAAKEIVWLRRLLKELGLPQHGPTILRIDNNGARELANNMMINQRTKHIDIRHHFIRQCIENKEITLEQCATTRMTADTLTKPLIREKFEECRTEMGIVPIDT
jgi:hypothetical protein